MVEATPPRGWRLGAGPRGVLRDLRPVEDGDPELLRRASDQCGGGRDQQQGAGDHQADVRAEVGREPVDAPDPGPESGVGGDRLVDRADPPDGPRTEGPFRPVLHLLALRKIMSARAPVSYTPWYERQRLTSGPGTSP